MTEPRKPPGKPSGVALVTTLFVILLVTVLAVALVQLSTTELTISSGFRQSLAAETHAESALRLVESQILEGSSVAGTAWISQPGAIRTFDADGDPAQTFKLYSSPTLVEGEAFDPNNNADIPPSAWRDEPLVWYDLNAPVTYGGNSYAPIIQGSLFDQAPGSDNRAKSSLVDGIAVESGRIENQNTPSAHVPMPVRWLYILEDGSFVSPEGSGDDLRLPGSSANPPVARVAFWTDDETCKVNINTASNGTFWDTPVANGWNSYTLPNENRPVFEADLAYRQPSQREYQRYPGHPATTSLAPVFGKRIAQLAGISDPVELSETLIGLNPRYRPHADQAGSRNSRSGTRRGEDIQDWKTDPFYATTDEMAFASSPASRSPRVFGGSAADDVREMVDWGRFLATSASRAPEVNLFGEPRVAMWPVHTDSSRQTSFDKLIAFCATLDRSDDPQKYYVTRTNPQNGTTDWNSDNRKLYQYLQDVTGRDLPGFGGGSFLAKYGAGTASPDGSGSNPSERDQILTMVLDYIRCANLQPRDGTAYTPVDNPGAGQVVPLVPGNGTRGLGRMISVSELVITACKATMHQSDGTLGDNSSPRSPTFDYEIALVPEFYSAMAGYSTLWPNMEVEFSGLDTISATFGGGNNAGYTGSPFAADKHSLVCNRVTGSGENDWKTGGPMGTLLGLRGVTPGPYQTFPHAQISIVGSTAPTSMTLSSGSITVSIYVPDKSSGVLVSRADFSFPSFTFLPPTAFQNNDTSGASPYVPGAPGTLLRRRGFAQAHGANGARTTVTGAVFKQHGGNPPTRFDVARSLVPAGLGIKGDARFLSAFAETTDFFQKIDGYDLTSGGSNALIHTMAGNSRTDTSHYPGVRMGSLLASVSIPLTDEPALPTYKRHSRPDIPPNILGVEGGSVPGDWDNGPWQMPDGAYANKVDEGSSVGEQSSPTTPDGSTPTYIPYIGNSNPALGNSVILNPTLFSPNRQIASPAVLGSIPTGIARLKPWQTLLFRPQFEALPGGMNHPGGGDLPDHAFLDLFWMPVVEPYPISDPFSTAGKVNLNHRIMPFNYLERTSALRGVFSGTQITALNPSLQSPNAAKPYFIRIYKDGGTGANGTTTHGFLSRRSIDIDNTLKILNDRFAASKETDFFDRNKDVTAFVSESEICEVPLVPADPPNYPNLVRPASSGFSSSTPASGARGLLDSFWSKHELTGDNSLERPYAQLYSRLTTKSNTYQVHVCAEVLKRAPGLPTEQIKSSNLTVVGRYRAAYTVERYLPAETTRHTVGQPLGPYKMRVLNARRIQ